MTKIRFYQTTNKIKKNKQLFFVVCREKMADILFNDQFGIVVYYSIFSLDYMNF